MSLLDDLKKEGPVARHTDRTLRKLHMSAEVYARLNYIVAETEGMYISDVLERLVMLHTNEPKAQDT